MIYHETSIYLLKTLTRKMSVSEPMKFKPMPKGKGLVFKITMDLDYGGFYYSLSKYRFELCLGFVAFRVFFMSEAKYDYLSGFVTMNKNCITHDLWPRGREEKEDECE